MKYVAIMDSESMTWVAVGKTEKEAKNAIQKKWNESLTRERMTAAKLEEYYGINIIPLKDGECFCW